MTFAIPDLSRRVAVGADRLAAGFFQRIGIARKLEHLPSYFQRVLFVTRRANTQVISGGFRPIDVIPPNKALETNRYWRVLINRECLLQFHIVDARWLSSFR